MAQANCLVTPLLIFLWMPWWLGLPHVGVAVKVLIVSWVNTECDPSESILDDEIAYYDEPYLIAEIANRPRDFLPGGWT